MENNCREELFIHASSNSIAKELLTNEYVVSLVDGLSMNYGNIICRGKFLTVNMTDWLFFMKLYNYSELGY